MKKRTKSKISKSASNCYRYLKKKPMQNIFQYSNRDKNYNLCDDIFQCFLSFLVILADLQVKIRNYVD